jgi:hypothetical protein
MAELQKAQLYDLNEVPIVPNIYLTLKEAWGWREFQKKKNSKKTVISSSFPLSNPVNTKRVFNQKSKQKKE